ncbi:MAG: alpha-1,2-fucosyltransferase [Betaproteobacteria bacterium]
MICVRLNGGLGNQLFQYAAGRALALRHGCELLLDASRLQAGDRHVTPRTFELDHFRHRERVATAAETRRLAWLHRVPAVSHWVSPWRTYVERGLGYNAGFAELPDQTYLVGYWQSPRYFASVAGQIAAELSAARPLSPASEAVAEAISQGPSVALHVRRGDYVSLVSAASLHGALGLPYYEAALQRVREQVEGARYFVFSDDIAWCREHLPLRDAEAVYVGHNTGTNAWQDIFLMASCRHHIIANSSFSWWGAWLADQRHGASGHAVIAPARWFAGRPIQDTSDRLPAHWMLL